MLNTQRYIKRESKNLFKKYITIPATSPVFYYPQCDVIKHEQIWHTIKASIVSQSQEVDLASLNFIEIF